MAAPTLVPTKARSTPTTPAVDERLVRAAYASCDDVLRDLGSSRDGITDDEVIARRAKFGRA
jgi:hypothetical protein